jgi:putative redox protein
MDIPQKEFIIDGSAVIGRAQYQTVVKSGNHTVIADEPIDDGGTDTGMSPYNLLIGKFRQLYCYYPAHVHQPKNVDD